MEFEQQQQAVFENTAENRARNSVIMWWVLHLSYMVNEEGKEVPCFKGRSYEEKLENYDEMEEEFDEFHSSYIKKLAFLISFWYTGRVSDEDDFKSAERMYDTSGGDITEDTAIEENDEAFQVFV